MKTLLRILVTASVVTFLILTCTVSFAGTPLAAKARAAIALSAATTAPTATTASKICNCGGDASQCTCGPDCACPICGGTKTPGPIEWQIYLIQYRKAVSQNKPLIIWIGETCPVCESQWTEYVHARLSEYNGEIGPGVIVAKPDGLGGMSIAGRFLGIPSKASVSGLLTPIIRQQQVYAPQPMPLMMPMMGGFGGGGGGC